MQGYGLHIDKRVNVERILTKGKRKPKPPKAHPGLVVALAQKLYAERQPRG